MVQLDEIGKGDVLICESTKNTYSWVGGFHTVPIFTEGKKYVVKSVRKKGAVLVTDQGDESVINDNGWLKYFRLHKKVNFPYNNFWE